MRNWSRLPSAKLAGCFLLVTGLLASGLLARAGDEKDAKQGQTIETKAAKRASAAATNFASALGLGLERLQTLGARIDQARRAPDPVALALLAKELAVAEEVAKKQARLKAGDLLKEAVEVAKARNRPEELRVVALLANGDAKDELARQADRADKQIEARKSGERQKGIQNVLHVDNRTGYYITIYVNWIRRGTVGPWGDIYVYVGDSPYDTTVLAGDAEGTPYYWGPKLVSGSVNNYTWTLNP
jgi:hypothetical protein